MAIAESLLPEFDHEMANTRKLLERIPADKASWKPHVKSMAMSDLGMHLANLPTWAPIALTSTEMDVSVPQATPRPTFESIPALLDLFDENVSKAREAIAATSDSEMMVPWSLKHDGNTMFTMPRAAVLRSFVLSHTIHHRGQLDVYLRLNDVPLPAIYGPSADTNI